MFDLPLFAAAALGALWACQPPAFLSYPPVLFVVVAGAASTRPSTLVSGRRRAVGAGLCNGWGAPATLDEAFFLVEKESKKTGT